MRVCSSDTKGNSETSPWPAVDSAKQEEDRRCLCGNNKHRKRGQAVLGMPWTSVQIKFPGAVCRCGPCDILSFPPWGTDKAVLSRPRASDEGIREKSNSGSTPPPFFLKVNNKWRSRVKCVLFWLDWTESKWSHWKMLPKRTSPKAQEERWIGFRTKTRKGGSWLKC